MSEDDVTWAWLWAMELGLEARTYPLGPPLGRPWQRAFRRYRTHVLEVRQRMTTLVFKSRAGFERWLDEEVRL